MATGIPPDVLMDQDDDVTVTMADIFEQRHEAAEAAKRKARRKG